jgi:hypothetical protein
LRISLRATVYMGLPFDIRGSLPSVNHTLGIQIGSVCCALRCPDDEVYDELSRLYRNFFTEQTADITIDLKRTLEKRSASGAKATFAVLSARPGLFMAEMECDPSEGTAGFKCLNRLFYLAYYSACLEKYGGYLPAMLVKACGVLRQGRALVFAGPFDSAKTIAGLCGEKEGRVINDEIVLVSRPDPDGWGTSVQSAPIIGGFPPGINITVPLSCILLLKTGNRTRVRPVESIDAYLRFVRQIVTPSCIGQGVTGSALSLVVDFGQETTGSVPVYELELTQDGESIWQEIGEIEGMLYGKTMK